MSDEQETTTAPDLNKEFSELKMRYDALKDEHSRAVRRGQDVSAIQQQLDSIRSTVFNLADSHQLLLKGDVPDEEANAAIARLQQHQTRQSAQDAISNMRRQVIDIVNDAGLDWHSDAFADIRGRFDTDPIGARDAALKALVEQLKQPKPTPSTDIPEDVLKAAVEAELAKRESARQDTGDTTVASGPANAEDVLSLVTNKRTPVAEREQKLNELLNAAFGERR